MMKILRSEAIIFASFIKMFTLSEREKTNEMENAISEIGIEEVHTLTDPEKILRQYIERKLSLYRNKYIEKFIFDKSNFVLEISDFNIELQPCSCCGYKTLAETAEYCICRVCYWEDDGTVNETHLSSPNKMTLATARLNFKKYGVMAEYLLDKVDPERMLQFESAL